MEILVNYTANARHVTVISNGRTPAAVTDFE